MNMSQAVQLCKGLAKQHRAVLAVAEVMEEIVNLEDMRDEALKQCKEIVAAKKNAVSEKEQVEKSLYNIKEEIVNVEHIRKEMLDKAHLEASIVVTQGANKAEDIIRKAKEKAYLVSSSMVNDRNIHMEEMEEIVKEIQEKEEHLDKIKKSLVRIKERLG